MPKQSHYAVATLKSLDLSKAGSAIEITVRYDNSKSDFYDDDDPAVKKVGVLKIGYGGLHWKAGRKQKAKHISWSTFSNYMRVVQNH